MLQSGNVSSYDVSNLSFDGNGNILSLTRNNEGGGPIDVLSYSYTTGTNRLTSVTDAIAPTPEDWDAEDTKFSYDGNGNVTAVLENGAPAISSIKYDHRNLPTSLLNRNGDVVSYRYNAGGQRIFKQVGSQTPEYYIMDGNQTTAVFENGAVKYWNILANGVVGRHDAAGGSKFYYLKDHLGTTRAVVDAAGTVKEALDYYPYGLLMPGRIYQSGSETKEKFTGKELDRETGWHHFLWRPYLPSLGRWLVVEPLMEKYPSFSFYSYAANNPLRYIDSDGRLLYDKLGKRITLKQTLVSISQTISNFYSGYQESTLFEFEAKQEFKDLFDTEDWSHTPFRRNTINIGPKIANYDERGNLLGYHHTMLLTYKQEGGGYMLSTTKSFFAFDQKGEKLYRFQINNEDGTPVFTIIGTKEELNRFLKQFGSDLANSSRQYIDGKLKNFLGGDIGVEEERKKQKVDEDADWWEGWGAQHGAPPQ